MTLSVILRQNTGKKPVKPRWIIIDCCELLSYAKLHFCSGSNIDSPCRNTDSQSYSYTEQLTVFWGTHDTFKSKLGIIIHHHTLLFPSVTCMFFGKQYSICLKASSGDLESKTRIKCTQKQRMYMYNVYEKFKFLK